MIVYSQKIIRFLHDLKSTLKEVLTQEIRLKVHGDRFYDRRQVNSYPIQVVIFNQDRMLGYFDPNFYELGFNECLMHSGREQLRNVIRHELAHYLTFILHGETAQPHAPEFKAFCRQMGWGEEVYQASFHLEPGAELEESAIFRKVQKLMALSTSSNKNEAEQAMIKSQQLLLKHNIESRYIEGEEEEKIFLKRLLKQKRKDAKMCAIGTILSTFFVSVVFTRSGDFVYLEILGNGVNVEIAEYVANILHVELEKLWHQAKGSANLKGAIARNSFFFGLAKGYCNKIEALKREHRSDVSKSLMVIEKKLMDAKAMVYQRLSSSKSGGYYCAEASSVGEQMGRQLTINPAIKHSKSECLLT